MSKYSEENLRAEFDRIRAERREAGEKAKEAAEKPYLVEASQLAWDAYAHGVTKDIIHTANRDYYNASRRRALWAHYTPSEPIEDLRSRGKGAAKSEQPFEWVEHDEFEDVVRFTLETGQKIDFRVVTVNETEPAFEALDESIDYKLWWPQYKDMLTQIRDSWNARKAARDI